MSSRLLKQFMEKADVKQKIDFYSEYVGEIRNSSSLMDPIEIERLFFMIAEIFKELKAKL